MKRALPVLALLISVATGIFLYWPRYRPITFYVDGVHGDDSSACDGPGAQACKTIQGAISKAPKLLERPVVINAARGEYQGFNISGFTAVDGGSLLIQGSEPALNLDSGLVRIPDFDEGGLKSTGNWSSAPCTKTVWDGGVRLECP